MSDHNENKRQTILSSLLPPILLLAAETALWFSHHELTAFIAGFSLSVLSAQWVGQLVFVKGEICHGQRSRLIKGSLYLAVYWLGLLLLGALAAKRYIPQALVISAALLLLFAVWQQPKDDERLRRGLLLFANICGVIGLLAYLSVWLNLPLQDWLRYSPFSQLLLGLVVASWLLRVARNRLQGLIALLPRLMLLMVLLNAVYSVIVLLSMHLKLILPTAGVSGFASYFAVHLLTAAVLGWLILKNRPLTLPILGVLLLLAISFPFWLFG
ncbi:hypothetical protein [Chelonobacter oris]|uniref:hypothetical protein n=1 Tax=Chelonobacter oris TaxID=505317 RepID=UPI000690FE5C|nr:hypothetical protein [Chelonobacter oris]